MITPIYVGLLTLLLVGLSIHVIRYRKKSGIAMGDAENFEITRRVRAQANFIEYTPTFLIALGWAEHQHLSGVALHVIGMVFFLGRLVHAYSMLKAEVYEDKKLSNQPTWRIYGMMCTFVPLTSLSLIILVQSLL